MADTPEQRYERLSDTVRQTILRNFPNPERKGCPGDAVVRDVAGRRELIEDDAWQHITHCSPCYAAFLQFKDEFRTHRRRRGLGIVAGAVVVALIAGVAIYERNHNEQKKVGSQDSRIAAAIDLRDRSTTRSADAPHESVAPLFLPRGKLALTIYLPFGSEAGKYDVQVRRAGEELVSAQGDAKVNRGTTELRVQFDLSKYPPGVYAVAVRQAASSWVENPVTLR